MDRRNEKKRPLASAGKLQMLTAIVLVAVLVFLMPMGVSAETDTVALTGNALKDCGKDDVVTVTFQLPAEVYLCDFTALISYDAALLEPVKSENADGDMVWVDTEVFSAGIVSNVVEGEGIRVAGATAQAGYKKGGTLFSVKFKVLKALPAAGTEVKVGFSVFHVAPTAAQTLEKSVSVQAATLAPKAESAGTGNNSGNNGNNGGNAGSGNGVTTPATEPSTEPTEDTAPSTAPATEPDGGDSTTPTTQPSGTEPDATEPADQAPKDQSPLPGILIGCGAVAAAGVIIFLLLKKKKKEEQ